MRELTAKERGEIRALAYQCANYDRPGKQCLIADSMCITLDCIQDIAKTATMCEYFRRAVLPLNSQLEATLTCREPTALRVCAQCGNAFVPKNNRQQYCSEKCKVTGRRRKDRELRRDARNKAG